MTQLKKTAVFMILKRIVLSLIMITLTLLSCPVSSIFDIHEDIGYAPRTLVYHSISDDEAEQFSYLYVSPDNFEEQLSFLQEHEYVTLFADEWQITDRPSVIITFDDGYADNYTAAFPLLKKYGVKATVFLITDMIGSEAYLNEMQITEMYDSGLVSFQSHSKNHENLSLLTKEELTEDLHLSALRIKDLLKYEVTAFSYPRGLYNDSVINTVSDFYVYAYTTESPKHTDNFTSFDIPRAYVVRDYDILDFYKLIS